MSFILDLGFLTKFPWAKSNISYFQGRQESAPSEFEGGECDPECADDVNESGFNDADDFSVCKKCLPSGLHSLVTKSEPLHAIMSKLPTNLRMMMLSACAQKLQLGALELD